MSSTPEVLRSWTVSAYDAARLSPFAVGGVVAGLLLLSFFASEMLLGRLDSGGLRLTIIHCLLAAYVPTAYVYLLKRSRRTVDELRVAGRYAPGRFEEFASSVGRYPAWALAAAGIAVIAVGVPVTLSTSDTLGGPWAWGALSPESRWHRVLSPIFSFYIGCFLYAVVRESLHLEKIGRAIRELDLLDLDCLEPFARQGLTNAGLMLGSVSLLSLFLLEPGYNILIAGSWITATIVATICMLLPLRGVRQRIRERKRQELDWCRDQLREHVDALRSGAQNSRLAEVIAYKELIENVREWPFDNPMLLRFALYLLIPLGSWAGGALVERIVDAALE